MQITIDEIMNKKIETIEESTTVLEVAKKMKDKNISSLIVVDNFGNSKGLITERDLVRKVCIKNIFPSEVAIKEVMSLPLITITAGEYLSTAIDIMLQHNIRHLLVVDDETAAKKPIGVVTPKDLTRYQEFTRDDATQNVLENILEYYI